MSRGLDSIDEERERLYAIAKELGLAWAAFRRRVYSMPPAPDTDEELPEPTDEVSEAIEIEMDTVSLLQQLADLYEGAERRGGDA